MTEDHLFSLAKHINDLYNIRSIRVYDFLKNRLFLLPKLESIPENIKKFFGDRMIELGYSLDPEDGTEMLIIRVIVNGLEVDEALDLLDRFDREYWLAELRDKDVWDNILIDIKYKKIS